MSPAFRRSLAIAGGLVVLMVALVALLAHADPMPSPPPDASKVRRGVVSIGPGEQVFAGLKVFDGGVVLQSGIAGPLWVDGGATVQGILIADAGIRATDGTAALPSYSFSSDPTMGWYRWGANGIGWSNAGVLKALIYNAGGGGTTSYYGPGNPSISFTTTTASLTTLTGGINVTTTGNTFTGPNGLGSGATDVLNTMGTSVADGTVNAGATLLQVSTGIGGTEVPALQIRKGANGGFNLLGAGTSGSLGINNTVGTSLKWSTTALTLDTSQITYSESGTFGNTFRIATNGLQSAAGTDTSGTPGAATVNKPRGISCIAIGASSAVITNSLATASSFVQITPLSRDTTCKELAVTTRAAGSFTASCTANATAATCFAWEVGGLL